MGKNLDTAERTAQMARAREQAKEQKLNNITIYTLTDLEQILGVTHRTLLQYVKDGRIKGVKVGGKWRITEENLKKFLNGD